MRSQSFFAAVFVAVLALPAVAQNPPTNHARRAFAAPSTSSTARP